MMAASVNALNKYILHMGDGFELITCSVVIPPSLMNAHTMLTIVIAKIAFMPQL